MANMRPISQADPDPIWRASMGVVRPEVRIGKASGASPKVLVYLPRGPSYANTTVDAACVTTLRKVWPYHIVQLNYRASRNAQYPTPIHDVLAGYDWTVEHLLAKRSIARAGRSDRVGQVAVCGELVGGALATMLALTECHAGQAGVAAAAVNCPMLDWTDLLTEHGDRPLAKGKPLDDLDGQLMKTRDALFRKPEHYFDPFASPNLFFRAPGVDVPPARLEVPTHDLEHLALLEREEYFQQHQALRSSTSAISEDFLDEVPVKRRARRVFPPMGSTLRLPPFNISASRVGPFAEQSIEMEKALRKSFIRQAGRAEFGRKVLTDEELDADNSSERKGREAEAAQKVQLDLHDDLRLWDDSRPGQLRVMEAGCWLLDKVT